MSTNNGKSYCNSKKYFCKRKEYQEISETTDDITGDW